MFTNFSFSYWGDNHWDIYTPEAGRIFLIRGRPGGWVLIPAKRDRESSHFADWRDMMLHVADDLMDFPEFKEVQDPIERVARAVCENMGLDPDERVGHGYGATYTSKEWQDEFGERLAALPAVQLFSPRWKTFRSHAAYAIATQKAIQGT